MTKPVLIMQLRPEDDTSDDEYAAILRYGELQKNQTTRMRIEKQGIPQTLNLADYSAVIVGGSPFDISTPEDQKSGIQRRIESGFNQLFKQIISEDFPFLGACSGNGLLGNYLGTKISGRYAEAVGSVQLTLTEAAREDSLLADYPEQIEVLLGHKEACDELPAGATLLMKGEQCPIQMFRLGNNVYATQFHPEADAQGFTVRIHAYKNHGYFQPDQADRLIQAVSKAQTPYAQLLLKRFVDRYARLQP